MSSASNWFWTSSSVLLAALAGAPAVAAEGQGIDVTVPSGTSIVAEPGRVLSLALRVASRSDVGLDLRETVDLPTGWRQIGALTGLELHPADTGVRLVLISVPPTTQAGTYTVTYEAHDRAQPSTRADATVQVHVGSVSGVAVSVDPRAVPEFLVAGASVDLPLTITNHGNHEARYRVEATGEDRLLVAVSQQEVRLAPGASAEVPIAVKTSREDTSATYRAVRVRVWDAAGGAEQRIAVPLTILPGEAERVARYRTVPGWIGLRAAQDDDRVGLQAEVGVQGALDADGKYRVDLLARGPDTVAGTTFGLRDELRLSLAAPFGQLQLGDQPYGATALTHPGRYGRGAGASFERDGWLAGVYHVASRFDDGAHVDTGVRFGHTIGEGGSVSLQALRTVDRARGTEDTVATVQSVLRDASGAQITAEVGLDAGSEGDGPDHAFRLAGIAGSTDRVQVAFDAAYGGPDYSGFYRDVAQVGGTVTLGLGETLGARLLGQSTRRNLELRPDRGSAPLDHRLEARATVRLPAHWTIEPGAAGAYHEERLAGALGTYVEGAGLLALAHTGRDWSLVAESRVGPHTDFDGDALLSQHTAALSVRPGGDRTLGAWATYGTPASASVLFSSGSTVGVSAAGPIVGRLDLTATAQRTFDKQARDQVDATLRLRPTVGPSLAARMRVTRAGGAPQLASELAIQQAIGVPIARVREVGAIEGSLLDGGQPDRPGLAGVLVSAGGRVAVTDRYGRFAIDGLAPGVYALQIDRRTLGPGRVARDRAPEALEVRGGDETHLTIVLVPAARIDGHARIEGVGAAEGGLVADRIRGVFGAGTAPVDVASEVAGAGPLGGVLVQASDGEETLTRMTAADGSFSFEGLRPGEWRVTLPATQIPGSYLGVATNQTVGLEPDETEAVELTVRPKIRRVRMEASAIVVVPTAPPPAAAVPRRPKRRPVTPPAVPAPVADPTPWLAPAAPRGDVPPVSPDEGVVSSATWRLRDAIDRAMMQDAAGPLATHP